MGWPPSLVRISKMLRYINSYKCVQQGWVLQNIRLMYIILQLLVDLFSTRERPLIRVFSFCRYGQFSIEHQFQSYVMSISFRVKGDSALLILNVIVLCVALMSSNVLYKSLQNSFFLCLQSCDILSSFFSFSHIFQVCELYKWVFFS